ncbi:MAG: hypothetical protein ACI4HN_01395 [Ruminococcus sp.]
MYQYEICNVFDKNIFDKQCAALEKNINGINKTSSLEDVDGSQITFYELQNGKQLNIENNVLFGVIINSEFPVEKYFN